VSIRAHTPAAPGEKNLFGSSLDIPFSDCKIVADGSTSDRNNKGKATMPDAFNEQTYAAAREWLIECFEDQEDEILKASNATIRREVDRLFDVSGWAGFVRGLEFDPCN
jgi:hypothetical protein